MIPFNDQNAWLNKSGNLSLGNSGQDDAAGNTSFPYAKDDFWMSVNVNALPAAIPVTNLTETNTRVSVGIYTRTYTAGAAITPKLPISISNLLPFHRTFLGSSGATSNPHGFILKSMIVSYIVGVAALNAIAAVFTTETAQAEAVARAAASTSPFGAVIVQNPPGTVAAAPLTTQATPHVVAFVPTTPAFVNTQRQLLTAELQLDMANTGTFAITEISLLFALAAY